MSVFDDLRLVTLQSERNDAPYDVLACWLLKTEPRRLDAWALVDDLSCALTLVIPVDDDQLTRLDPPDRDDTQHLLTRLIERFMGHKGVRQPGLLRRPALQLVLCPRGAALTKPALEQAVSKVELLHRRVEARVGLDLPDFKLTLEDRPRPAPGGAKKALEDPETPEGAEALSELARAFHLRFLPDTSHTPTLVANLKGVSDKVDDATKGLRKSAALLREPLDADPLRRALTLIDQIGDLGALPKTIDPKLSSREPTDRALATPQPPTPSRLRVAARHWVRPGEPQPEHAASLPLGALSLIVADNAAGKTNAAETFSLLTADLPRARPLPPLGSEALDGAVTLDVIGPAPEPGASLSWDNTSMLPIFSDDAGLTEGTPGALSVATMWPSVASNETLAALGAMARAARSFALWDEPEEVKEASSAVSPAGDWDARLTADLSVLKLVASGVDALFEGTSHAEPPEGLSAAHFDALNVWAGRVRRAPEPQADAQSTDTDGQERLGEDLAAAARFEHAARALHQLMGRASAPDDAEAAEALKEWASAVLSDFRPGARAQTVQPRPPGPSDEATDLGRRQEEVRGAGARRLVALLESRAPGAALLGVDGRILDSVADELTVFARGLAQALAQHLGPVVAPPIEAFRTIWPALAKKIRDAILLSAPNEARLQAALEVEAHVQPDQTNRLNTLLLQGRREANAAAKIAIDSWEATADRGFEWVLSVGDKQRKAIERMTSRLDQLLTHDVWYDKDRRRNTAALVRWGVAARLARAVLLSPHSLPMLTLDEPTLGQHRVASARAIARITRLARVIEGRRWLNARHIPRERPPGPPPERSLAAGRLSLSRPEGQETVQPREDSAPLHLNIKARLDLGPPMLLIFSYQEDALTRLAQLEGEQLTHGVSESLQALVAPWWRAELARAVRERDDAWFGATSRALPSSPKPPLLLQQIEGALPDQPSAAPTDQVLNEWLKGARRALGELGLMPLEVPLALPKGLPDLRDKDEPGGWRRRTLRASRELIRWLALVELLPAVMDDAPFDLHTSGVELRRLSPEGGEARRVGALRLRRVSPVMLSRVWAHDEDGRLDLPSPPSGEVTTTAPPPDPAPMDVVAAGAVASAVAGDALTPTTEVGAPTTTQEDTSDGSDPGAATEHEPTVTPNAGAQDDPPAPSVLGDLADERTSALSPHPPSPPSPPEATPPKPKAPPIRSRRTQLLSALLPKEPPDHQEELNLRLDDLRFSKTGPPELEFDARPEDRRRDWRISVDCAPQDVTLIGDGHTIPFAHVEEVLALLTRAATLRGFRRTLLTLDCTQPVAVAAGFFHNLLKGHPVDVMAGIPGRDMARFVLREPVPHSARALTPREAPAEVVPRGAELHVLVTLTTTANRSSYDTWRDENPTTEGPAPGLLWFDGAEAVNDGAQAAWLARVLHRSIVAHRPEGAALRLFLALPNVVCVALGQRLLNLGPVTLMALKVRGTREAPDNTYEEWGTLKT